MVQTLLIGSVAISMMAMAWSVVLMRRLKDWRIGFLTAMLGLITLRQVFTTLAVGLSWDASFAMNQLALHGIVIGILALFSVVFLEIVIRQHLEAQSVLRQSRESLRVVHEELKEAYDSLQRAQASAINAEKMAALGRLTSGACHEILNPVNNVTCRLQLMIEDQKTPEAMVGNLKKMDEQLERITDITRSLSTFSSSGRPAQEQFDINECAGSVVNLMLHDLELCNIALDLRLEKDSPKITADVNQLQQVVHHLLGNARDAMPEGGHLLLATETVHENGHEFVELRVEDSGEGIPAEHMDRLFEPFFTTRPEGERAGLGLAICHGIVEAHGGQIWAENLEEGGASFIVRLPTAQVGSPA